MTVPRIVPGSSGPVRACRTCHTLFEIPRPDRPRAGVDLHAAGEDRYCSKACRRDSHRHRPLVLTRPQRRPG